MRRWKTCCETQWGGELIWWILMLEDKAPWSGQSLPRTLGRDWFCVLPHRSPWTWVSLYRLSDLMAGPLFKRVGRTGLILDLVVPRQLLPACPRAFLPGLPPPLSSWLPAFAFVSSVSVHFFSEKSDAISSPGVCAGRAVGESFTAITHNWKRKGNSLGTLHAKKAKSTDLGEQTWELCRFFFSVFLGWRATSLFFLSLAKDV